MLGWSGTHSTAVVQSAFLTANVTMTSANTYYDGPSLLLGIGTWLVIAAADSGNATVASAEVAGKLWDGTTVYASSETYVSTTGAFGTVRADAIIRLNTPTTVKISVAHQSGSNGVLAAALSTNAAGNNATYILAIKLD